MRRWMTISMILVLCLGQKAQSRVLSLRRPLSSTQPMWIIHIDCWNYPDPEKIINLISADILPFVVFNISLSSNDNITHDGPLIIDSWIRTCAQKQVWCMIQPSSGAHNRLPEITADGTGQAAYEHYFQEFPNFIGFSFAEQFWDFGKNGCPTWEERQQTLLAILQLCHTYGGYLTMSFTQSYDNYQMMPMYILKNNEALRTQLHDYPEHFIVTEKYTMKKNFYDIESNCLGMFLSGYAGHYGIRFDTSGWMSNTDDLNDASDNPVVPASGMMPIIEHMLLTGQTVIDGPELTWQQVTSSASYKNTADNYKTKTHFLFPHCENTYLTIFRHIINGSWRILTRDEVINRTKICILNDITTDTRDAYVTPQNLFDSLYRFPMDKGGVTYGTGWQDQRWWTKNTGRYPSIPQVYEAPDGMTAVPVSQYKTRWSTNAAKQTEINSLFPQLATGDLFVAQEGNTWVLYNPYQYHDTLINNKRTFTNATRHATGTFNLSPITSHLQLWINNYRNNYSAAPYAEAEQQTNTIIFTGLTSQPTVTWTDEGNHSASSVQTSYANGQLTISATHNGALNITISDLQSSSTVVSANLAPYTVGVLCENPDFSPLVAPTTPSLYQPSVDNNLWYQAEAENMDYKGSVAICNKPGDNAVKNHYAQGYAQIAPSTSTSLRDTLLAYASGNYTLRLRYRSADTSSPVPFKLSVNNQSPFTLSAPRANDWSTIDTDVTLQQGDNQLLITFTSNWSTSSIQLDCVQWQYVDDEQGIDNPQSYLQSTKIIRDGVLLIIRNGIEYNAFGQQIHL